LSRASWARIQTARNLANSQLRDRCGAITLLQRFLADDLILFMQSL
jgi:hypothetical protein